MKPSKIYPPPKQIIHSPPQLINEKQPYDSKYFQLKEQISNEKLKAMMATRLLKKSTSQINVQNVATINKSVDNKTKLKEQGERQKVQTKWMGRGELKTSKELTNTIIKENRKQENEVIKSNKREEDDRIKIYNQPFTPFQQQKEYNHFLPESHPDHFPPRDKTFTQSLSTNSSAKVINKISIHDFRLGKLLGTGKFGQVFMAQHIKTGFLCAIKRIKKSGLDEILKNQLLREIRIQTFLNHPNIVKMYTFFSDKQCIYLVLELCISGQLYNFVRKQKYINEDLAKLIIRQISQGLDYIHENKIIHRDLKPQNILFHHGLMKICDFGWSIDTHLMRETFCGTPLYVSPQLLKKKYYDHKVDIWGLGVLSYELLLGKVPFEIFTESDFKKIINDDIKFSQSAKISAEARDFIEKCLEKDPDKRMNSSQLLGHPFLMNVEITNFPQIF